MKVYIQPLEQSLILHAIRDLRKDEATRTGLHCSDIVQDIAIAQGWLKQYDTPLSESQILSLQEIGNALEDIVADQLLKRFAGWTKPAPRTYRGVICSPDGYSPRVKTIDEVKVLWKSLKDFVVVDRRHTVVEMSEKFQQYLLQVLFYMEAWGCDRGRIHALFINGDYRPMLPQPVTFVLKPTREERRTNADMMIQHAIDRKRLTLRKGRAS